MVTCSPSGSPEDDILHSCRHQSVTEWRFSRAGCQGSNAVHCRGQDTHLGADRTCYSRLHQRLTRALIRLYLVHLGEDGAAGGSEDSCSRCSVLVCRARRHSKFRCDVGGRPTGFTAAQPHRLCWRHRVGRHVCCCRCGRGAAGLGGSARRCCSGLLPTFGCQVCRGQICGH